jgi:hypothetical protein
VNLIPFPTEYLRRDARLPFGVYDAGGRLLLAAGNRVDSDEQLEALISQQLFVDETATADWKRRVQAAMDTMIRKGATLIEVASAEPEPEVKDRPAHKSSLSEQWDLLISQLDATLREVRPDTDWLPRLLVLHERARQLLAQRTDASLYYLVYSASQPSLKYSSGHAMLSMVLCELAWPLLAWPAEWGKTVTLAALCMNVAMLRLQDQLANSRRPPSQTERAEIDGHAAAGAQMLIEGGLNDPLCTAVVRSHHAPEVAGQAAASLLPAQQVAQLLRRVDIFAAKLSRRATRQPMTPTRAARQACLGPDGVPDAIGGAVLKAVGLYPPGSFVELASGEIGVVVARGRRADLPLVASLRSPSGEVLLDPPVRDSVERRYAVKCALQPDSVKVNPPHDRLMRLN